MLTLRGSIANRNAKILYQNLTADYNRLIRPVSNTTERLTIKLGLKLSQLIGIVSTNISTDILYIKPHGYTVQLPHARPHTLTHVHIHTVHCEFEHSHLG